MLATTNCKQLLAILTTIQWLKVIKYINGVVPKFALATSVLSHGLADLLMFFVFFCWSIISFSQLFFMQLGPYMEGYATLLRSMITLARALFGDFDMESVINISNGWLNAMFFIAYLFVAVFILLSIFLTILGEYQAQVREEQAKEREAGEERVSLIVKAARAALHAAERVGLGNWTVRITQGQEAAEEYKEESMRPKGAHAVSPPAERSAEGQRTDVAHKNHCRIGIEPEKSQTSACDCATKNH